MELDLLETGPVKSQPPAMQTLSVKNEATFRKTKQNETKNNQSAYIPSCYPVEMDPSETEPVCNQNVLATGDQGCSCVVDL